MSQFNETTGLNRISLFDNFNDIQQVDTPTESDSSEIYYKATINISTSHENTLYAIADIKNITYNLFGATMSNVASNTICYRARLKLTVDNPTYIKFSVHGADTKYYRARFTSWDDRNILYGARVKIPVKFSPDHMFKATMMNKRPPNHKLFKATITVSPRARLDIGYDLLSGGMHYFKAHTVIGKEYEKMYKARLVINPTNRLMAIGNVVGYNEPMFRSTTKITAERIKAYPAIVKIMTSGHVYTKVNIQQTPKHFFYGDLKKDAHVVATNPNSNYGGDESLYMNNLSVLFLEWDFRKNKDQFYKPQLESGAGLRLFLKKALPEASTGTVYMVDENWDEYGITYNNKPTKLTKIVDFEIPGNFVGRKDIYLGGALEDISKVDQEFVISLAVVIDSPIDTYSFSREKGRDIPALYYDYYYIPPNNRQREYRATMTVVKAYGKGDGKGTEFPDLGEQESWSYPAKLYRAKFTRAKTEPINTYNAIIRHTRYDNDGILYKARFFNVNIQNRNMMIQATMDIPIFDNSIDYIGTMNIPFREVSLFKATVDYIRRMREISYLAKFDNIKGYGVGYDEEMEYPDLGQEDKWSGEAPHWKATLNILSNKNEMFYNANMTVVLAYGKGDDTGIGKEEPWSKPAPHWLSQISIPIEEREHVYNATFLNDNRKYHYFKGNMNIPTFEDYSSYMATQYVIQSFYAVFGATINITAKDDRHLYKATIRNARVFQHSYNAKVKIISDRARTRIFIM